MSYNDGILIQSTHEAPEITENFCRQIFDDYEIKIMERLGEKKTTVYKNHISIDTFLYNPPDFMKQIARDDYGFVPNFMMSIFYSKVIRDIQPLQDVILKGVVGLIKTTDYSIVLEFEDPTGEMLIYHASELTLLNDSRWTEERLLLFKDLPYQFKNP